MQSNIGKNLRLLRRLNGYTQQNIADIVHITPQAISRWELGEVEPSLDILNVLADLYGLTMNDLTSSDLSAEKILEFKQEKEKRDIQEKELAKKTNNKLNFFTKLPISTRINICVGLSFLLVGSIGGTLGGISLANKYNDFNIIGASGEIDLLSHNYKKNYLDGEQFQFRKSDNVVNLNAIDPNLENEVLINNLPGPEYGFIVSKEVEAKNDGSLDSSNNESSNDDIYNKNNDSEFYLNANEITIHKDMGTIYLVSRMYRNIRVPLYCNVYDIDQLVWGKHLKVEGEDANIYKDDQLLTRHDLETLPSIDKPYLSNYGASRLGEDAASKLSGGACLRNFKNNPMRIELMFLCDQPGQVNLKIGACGRNEKEIFGNYYYLEVNGVHDHQLDLESIYTANEYFEPLNLPEITIMVNKGINSVCIYTGKKYNINYTLNFDYFELKAETLNVALLTSTPYSL